MGQENAYKEVIKTAVGGAAGVIHQVESATTDCQPNENVEALRVFMLGKKLEAFESGSVVFECKEGAFVPHEEEGILEVPAR